MGYTTEEWLHSYEKITKREEQDRRRAEQDRVFWDKVRELTFALGTGTYLDDRFQDTVTMTPRGVRSVPMPQRYVSDPLYQIYLFFANSPNECITMSRYVVKLTGEAPYAYDRRALLLKLRNIINTPEATALCRYIDSYLKQGDGIAWEKAAVVRMKIPKERVVYTKQLLDEVYNKWFQYVKRYEVKQNCVREPEKKLALLSICLDGIRHRDFVGGVVPIRDVLRAFQIQDKTLCFSHTREQLEKDPMLSPVITYERLNVGGKALNIASRHQKMFVEILRLYQQCENRRMKNTGRDSARSGIVSYWWNGAEYRVYYDKEKGKFWSRMHGLPQKPQKCLALPTGVPVGAPKEFLYALTGGDWNALCQLARVMTHCAWKRFPGAVEISADTLPIFMVLFEETMGLDDALDWKYKVRWRLSDVVKEAAKEGLVKGKALERRVLLCVDDSPKMSEEQKKRLKKLMTGATVKYKDKVLGRILHKNEQQWIVVGTHKTHKKLTAIGIPTLQLPELDTENLPEGGRSLWFRTFFLLWGYLQLDKRARPKVDVKPLSLDRFLRERCTLLEEDGEFIEARRLWMAYTEFCQQSGYKEQLLFKDFNALMEQKYGLKRRRLHRGKGDNKTGYDRIVLNVCSGEEPGLAADKQSVQKDVFFRQVDQIQKEVLEHFPNFPFEKLIQKS